MIGSTEKTIKYTKVLIVHKPCLLLIALNIVPIKDITIGTANPIIAKTSQITKPNAFPTLSPSDKISTTIIEESIKTIANITATIILYALKFFISFSLLVAFVFIL
jgi:hypothetical protein